MKRTKTNQKPIPPWHELERVAALALTTVPTVRNYLLGAPGKSRIAARVKAALLELGFEDSRPAQKTAGDR